MNLKLSLSSMFPAIIVLVSPLAAATMQTTNAIAPPVDATFPIGIYSVPATDKDFSFAKEMGANYVQWYGLGAHLTDTAKATARTREYLDFAQSHGLKVLLGTGVKRLYKSPGGMEAFEAFVQTFKDHPAVGMWYIFDEPDGHATPDQIKPYYQYLKTATPNIPVTMALNWTEHWMDYRDVTDVILNDLYPVAGQAFPDAPVQHITTFTAQALKLGPAVMPVLQCFNWASITPKGAETYRGSPVDKLRYPNAAEMRYMIYGTLAQGASGEFFWSYYHGNRYDPQWMKQVFAPVIGDLRQFTAQIAPASKPTRLRRAEDDNAYMSLWVRPTGTWLVLVNAWPQERDLSRWTEGNLSAGRLAPVYGTASTQATLSDGRVKVHAQPWEVFIWKVEPATEEK